ncbi:MAG: deoxyribodipyrimidine photo-lyase, partial [Chitinophagia bacterium]|nr:deoxyribodipyrimidine photo-lyase [Chitinophagia bacterium]
MVNVFWFRRDLRLHDNAGLYHALKGGLPVLPVFILDTQILDQLEHTADRRVDFIVRTLHSLHQQLVALGSGLTVLHGTPRHCLQQLTEQYA